MNLVDLTIGEPGAKGEPIVAKGEIVATQEPIIDLPNEYFHQGRVEIYSFEKGFVQIPTIIPQRASDLVQKILGKRKIGEALLVSPNFGKATKNYFKAIEKIRFQERNGSSFSGRDGRPTHWSTDEDTVRYWATERPEFLAELTQQGWMYFEPFKEVDQDGNKELRKLGIRGVTMKEAVVPLENLIRVADQPGADLGFQVADLREIQTAIGEEAKNMRYVCDVSDLLDCYNLLTTIPGLKAPLVLSEIDTFLPDREINRPVPLRRTICLEMPFLTGKAGSSLESPWWNREHTNRTLALIGAYAAHNGLKTAAQADYSDPKSPVVISISDRNYRKIEKGAVADTNKLIAQATALRDFVKHAVSLEKSAHETRQDSIYGSRLAALGIPRLEVKP